MMEALQIVSTSWPLASVVIAAIAGITLVRLTDKVAFNTDRIARIREERNRLLTQALGRELSYVEREG